MNFGWIVKVLHNFITKADCREYEDNGCTLYVKYGDTTAIVSVLIEDHDKMNTFVEKLKEVLGDKVEV